jgi:hypothetical protein
MDRVMAVPMQPCLNRALATAIAGLVLALFAPATNSEAQQSGTPIICTNPASGSSWQIMINYQTATVDSNPAEITRAEISWFDPKDGGNYKFDRASGELTGTVASSTGGYFRNYRCDLEKSR